MDIRNWLNQGKRPNPESRSTESVRPTKKTKSLPADDPESSKSEEAHSEHENSKDDIKSNPDSQARLRLKLEERTGDIFDAPNNTLIIHACNCQGSWGGGIALAFKKHYPLAYKSYAAHCRDNEDLIGTAQLIPPLEKASANKRHFVGCLYTSRKYGKARDSPQQILKATAPAMRDLMDQVARWNADHLDDGERIGEVRMCKINSGLFAVEWDQTVDVLSSMVIGENDITKIIVVERV